MTFGLLNGQKKNTALINIHEICPLNEIFLLLLPHVNRFFNAAFKNSSYWSQTA